MGSEWTQITLGELLEQFGGGIKTGPFGTKLKASEYSSHGVPVISVGEVQLGRIVLHERTPRVGPDVTTQMPEYLLHEGDIVFGRKGAVERSARVNAEQSGWFLGSDGIRVRLPKTCDSRFVSYQLLTKNHQQWMIQHSAGTTMASLNEKIVRRVPLVLPPIDIQKKIAGILSALDDKITLNHQTNTTLESMAQTLFKSWFVDFDPVIDNALAAGNPIPEPLQARADARAALGDQRKPQPDHIRQQFPDRFVETEEMGWVPEGWEPTVFGRVSECFDKKRIPLSKKQRQEKSPGTIPYYGATSVMDYVDEWIFNDIYLLVGEDGSVIKEDGTPFTQYIWGKAWVNNHAHVLQGKGDICTEHLLLFAQ